MLIDPTLLAALLATADPRAPVTLAATAPAGEWRRLLGVEGSAPENLSTKQCADTLGWSDKDWRRWAPEIPGALRDGKKWRIPRDAAKAHADRMMKRDRSTDDGAVTTAPPQRRGGNPGKPRSRKEDAKTVDLNERRRGGNYGKFRSLKQGYRPPER